ncbi:MAG: hypothetical protein JXQ29_02495 [Planctomycetes bacterium]|nr:hypothetical protein [Planctomycetota bacterium]
MSLLHRLLSVGSSLFRDGRGFRLALVAAYLALVLHPDAPLRSWLGPDALVLSLPGFVAALALFEIAFHRWCGADRLPRALDHYRNGDLCLARRALERVVRLNRHRGVCARASGFLAALHIEQGRFAEASGCILAARSFEESRAAKAHHLALEGMIHHLLGQPREALNRLESAASMRPRKPVRGLIHVVRAALVLFHESRPEFALAQLDRAAALPGHPLADRYFPVLSALALAESENLDEARAMLAGVRGPLPLAPYAVGRILQIEHELENAVAAYEEALAALGGEFILYRALVRFRLGTACLELGRVETGSHALLEALEGPLPKPYRRVVPKLALPAETPSRDLTAP